MIGRMEPQPHDMLSFLEHGIRTVFRSIRVPGNQSASLLKDLNELALCMNQDRSLIGIHSAIANDYFQAWDDFNGDVGALLLEVNNTPRAPLQWATPIEESLELLAASVA